MIRGKARDVSLSLTEAPASARAQALVRVARGPLFCYLAPMAKRAQGHVQAKYGQSGYPAVEKLIDTEDFSDLNDAFEVAYAELFDLSKRKKGMKTQRDTKKAMRSLELTMDLLRELLAIKYRLQEEASRKGKG